jgi:hypothetical protein
MAGSFFFHRRSPGPRLTNAAIQVEVIEFAAALGNGVDTEAGNAGQAAVTAIAQHLGLQPSIQATLTLVESADQEIDLGVERLGRMGLELSAYRALAVVNRSLFHSAGPSGEMMPPRIRHAEARKNGNGGTSRRPEDERANDEPILPMQKTPKLFFYGPLKKGYGNQ